MVAVDPRAVLRDLDRQRLRLANRRGARRLDGLRDRARQVDGFELEVDLSTRDAADVQQVVHQADHLLELARHRVVHQMERAGLELLAPHERHRVRDRRQRVAQFMAQHGQEGRDAAAFVFERGHAAPLGEVARHLGEPAQRAAVIVQGGDHDVGPEPAAVLAHPPALLLEAAVAARAAQFLIRPAARGDLGRIEHREVPADDFRGLVALGLPRAGVPADDMAAGVEHEDRVVLHAFYQQTESLLAHAQQFFMAAPLREVPHDLREAAELAGRPVQPRDDDVGPEAGSVLAQPPVLVLEAAGQPCGLQLMLGPSAVEQLGGIEHREMAAHDFVRLVAVDLLRAGVPAQHQAVRIHEEDRVVGDRFDHHAIVGIAQKRTAQGAQRRRRRRTRVGVVCHRSISPTRP